MAKALNYLSLARKGGMAELGEEPVGAVARAGKAHLILVAQDASDHTWRRAKSFAAGTDQQVLHLPVSKEEMGAAIGRTSLAIAAITDVALALALVKSMDEGPERDRVQEVLQEKTNRKRQREKEAKAHIVNVRKGKTRKGSLTVNH